MVIPNMDPLAWLRKHLEEADTDLLREMVATFVQALMDAEANVACGADYGERSPDRQNQRNGYREHRWDTRAGTIELRVPKLRTRELLPRLAPGAAPPRRAGTPGGYGQQMLCIKPSFPAREHRGLETSNNRDDAQGTRATGVDDPVPGTDRAS